MLNTRRGIMLGLGAVLMVAPLRSLAQRQDRTWRVGFLSARTRPQSLDADYYGAFPRRMRELGYVEGRNLIIEWRFADGDYDRLPALAAELVKLKVDVIVALGPPGALAAQKATVTIPIVFVVSSDPVQAGLVKSMAQPGGNMTGLSNLAGDLSSKHLEKLLAMSPKLSRVAVLVNPANTAHEGIHRNVQTVAQKSGVKILAIAAKTPAEIDGAFSAMAGENAGALIVALDPLFIQQGSQIAEQAAKHRLPSIFANREYAEAGGLMSYGQNQVEIYRRAAGYVDRLFKGAKPGELPVEQPTKLEFVINVKTAKALGLTIPQSLLTSADKVIE
jgi:putative tryptophan/tyrosine transport system substrate-binding protein